LHAFIYRPVTEVVCWTLLQTLVLIVWIVQKVNDSCHVLTRSAVLALVQTLATCSVAELAHSVCWVLVLTCVARQCAHCLTDLLEVRLRIRWSRCAVDLASCAGCETCSCAQTAAWMALCACPGSGIGVKSVRADCQTTAVAGQEEKVGGARGSIETLFGVVLAGGALRTALLAKVKNVGVDELTSGTGDAASVCSDVFVVRSFGGGRDECVGINGGGGDVLTRLTGI
jgi:hypothetical protein